MNNGLGAPGDARADGGAAAPSGVHLDALRGFFAARVGGSGGPLSAVRFEGGRSNLTYLISDGEHEWVLRRPPLGHVLPTAHDMAREYRVLSALHGTVVPVPRPIAFCDDERLLGVPFYVMTKVDGMVVRRGPDAAALTADGARRASSALVETLVRVHELDYEAVGLAGFGRPSGYLERQVRRWGQQWERSKTRPLPAAEELLRRLAAAVPPESGASVVHGDYRLDNLILALDDPGRVAAVVDWEMATLGDPLADLGLLLVYSDPVSSLVTGSQHTMSANPGFMTTDEIARLYAGRRGLDLDQLDFYVALAYFKLAAIAEGIHARYQAGLTLGEDFETVGASVPLLAQAGLQVAAASTLPGLRAAVD
jgi:aminoglycoside phosphotransferase (APT) family kinase protein